MREKHVFFFGILIFTLFIGIIDFSPFYNSITFWVSSYRSQLFTYKCYIWVESCFFFGARPVFLWARSVCIQSSPSAKSQQICPPVLPGTKRPYITITDRRPVSRETKRLYTCPMLVQPGGNRFNVYNKHRPYICKPATGRFNQ